MGKKHEPAQDILSANANTRLAIWSRKPSRSSWLQITAISLARSTSHAESLDVQEIEILQSTSLNHWKELQILTQPIWYNVWVSNKTLCSLSWAPCSTGQLWVSAPGSLPGLALPQKYAANSLVGHNFARGHKEASGGIVNTAEFEELCLLMKVGEKPDKPEGETPKKKVEKSPQKNTLNNYFKKSWTEPDLIAPSSCSLQVRCFKDLTTNKGCLP